MAVRKIPVAIPSYWHSSITVNRILEIRNLCNRGICLACGRGHYDIEPMAQDYLCVCGQLEVQGRAVLLAGMVL